MHNKLFLFIVIIMMIFFSLNQINSSDFNSNPELDQKVKKFLDNHKDKWHDLNVPAVDGKLLFDIIIKNNYKSCLEIGTSTGHSGIWIAWALSKTKGKLITIEIDEKRYKEALLNFKEAGLSDYIDARLADAHELVNDLKGPYDFIFSDADKEWYKNYFLALSPKLKTGGCFAAHNVRADGLATYGFDKGIKEFYDYIKSLNNYETTVNENDAGVSISYKLSD
jgi:caffeoyl-CoA O-methyltransferase